MRDSRHELLQREAESFFESRVSKCLALVLVLAFICNYVVLPESCTGPVATMTLGGASLITKFIVASMFPMDTHSSRVPITAIMVMWIFVIVHQTTVEWAVRAHEVEARTVARRIKMVTILVSFITITLRFMLGRNNSGWLAMRCGVGARGVIVFVHTVWIHAHGTLLIEAHDGPPTLRSYSFALFMMLQAIAFRPSCRLALAEGSGFSFLTLSQLAAISPPPRGSHATGSAADDAETEATNEAEGDALMSSEVLSMDSQSNVNSMTGSNDQTMPEDDECTVKQNTPTVFEGIAAWQAYGRFGEVCELGRGQSGRAILLRSNESDELVVCKQVHIADTPVADMAREVAVLSSLESHPHVIEYHSCFQMSELFCIITEFAAGGNLRHAIGINAQQGVHFAEDMVRRWTVQLASAIHHLHQVTRVLHRDVKPSNIFLTALGEIKLGDFGLARKLISDDDRATTVCGTPYYISPEQVNGQNYGMEVDVWAFGCVLYEMLCLQRPFGHRSSGLAELAGTIARGEIATLPLEQAPYSADLKALPTTCALLHADPKRRTSLPRLLEILQQPSPCRVVDAHLLVDAQLAAVRQPVNEATASRQACRHMTGTGSLGIATARTPASHKT